MPDLSSPMIEMPSDRTTSACPGLFRIVPALDGGLCRIKLPLGHLTADQARNIAVASERFGNGVVEATNRSNLQLRGVRRDSEAALIDSLLDAGLGPVNPGADDVRNVMVSPTAGIDPDQIIDTRPIAHALLTHLQTDSACRKLSPKFSVLIDGGERVAAIGHPHDVWLASLGNNSMALGIAGSPPTLERDCTPFLIVPSSRAIESVAAAIELFLDMTAGKPDATRFRHLTSYDALDRLGAILGVAVQRNAAWRRELPEFGSHIGIRKQRQTGTAFVGAVPPLGRLSPQMLVGLASVTEKFGSGQMHLTPWQSILVPEVRVSEAANAIQTLEALGLICDLNDPLASMIACAGSTGCAASPSDTKSDALALARKLPAQDRTPNVIHLSGCAKSCASARPADITLVASGPGTYELFRRAGETGNRFGQSMGGDLSINDASMLLNRVDAT